ncbi:MAG: RNA polymerase factor sigma-54 [Candidatus Hydrogenedentes bacterium]|nr:RNA polymerase factor sigma-54 [Candidatus Hydrogenedentota bacterium]
MMHMEHRLTQTQRQQLVLTQKMQQALHILQLNGIELEQYIQQEIETNPFLDQPQSRDDMPEIKPVADTVAESGDFEEPFDLDRYSDKWDIRHREGKDLSYNSDLEARRRFYEDSITKEESLRAHLLGQLSYAIKDPGLHAMGERIIIGDIDDRGYFTGNEEEIAEELDTSPEAVSHVLRIIQGFEPTGVGAHDVVECLLLQIDAEFPHEPELKILVRDYLEELKQRQIPKIAKSMNVRPERVEDLKRMLATLNPWPGHEYTNEPPQYIAPEVVVEEVEGKFMVRLASDRMGTIQINDDYHKSLKTRGLKKEDKDYVRGKIESARWLQRNIEQRQQTILRVSQSIVDFQTDFLRKGIEQIRPLTLQVIADEVGVHESTVARTTRGKYIQTPQGLFELKFFFSPGLQKDDGSEAQSSKSVQAQIQKIVEAEDKRKPLSDQKIANLLKKEGTQIARRTVTKYREALNIPSTTMRKQYQQAG